MLIKTDKEAWGPWDILGDKLDDPTIWRRGGIKTTIYRDYHSNVIEINFIYMRNIFKFNMIQYVAAVFTMYFIASPCVITKI